MVPNFLPQDQQEGKKRRKKRSFGLAPPAERKTPGKKRNLFRSVHDYSRHSFVTHLIIKHPIYVFNGHAVGPPAVQPLLVYWGSNRMETVPTGPPPQSLDLLYVSTCDYSYQLRPPVTTGRIYATCDHSLSVAPQNAQRQKKTTASCPRATCATICEALVT